MDWWTELTPDQRLTIALAFASALLGGVISLSTSWLLAYQSNRASRLNSIAEKKDQKVFFAHQGFIKILQFANSAYSVKKAIDGQFDEANEAGHIYLEPVMKVQEILATEADFEAFQAEELVFLLHSKDANLVGDLIVFEKRVLAQRHVVRSYNEKRAELGKYIEAGLTGVSSETGTLVTSDLSGRDAILVRAKSNALNNLLGNFMQTLERDVSDGKELLERYKTAARTEFGNLFANLKLEAE